MDTLFLILEKKTWFLALVGLTYVIGTSVRKHNVKRVCAYAARLLTFSSIFDQQSIQNRFKISITKRSTTNMEFDAKRFLKWSQNRYQKSSKINVKTGNKKDQENHKRSCFSEW